MSNAVKAEFVELPAREVITPEKSPSRAKAAYERMKTRRTVRDFSPTPVPRETIEWAIKAAGTAPSGAHKQPWTFVAVSNAALKGKIREAAEAEERAFYGGKASDEWLEDLVPFGTNWRKPFLEIAPWLIVVFQQSYGLEEETGARSKHYYVQESVGLASGMLISALHEAGLATLTHTPSPMKFLSDVLGRPVNERAIMIVVAGYPSPGATVPKLDRKSLDQMAVFKE